MRNILSRTTANIYDYLTVFFFSFLLFAGRISDSGLRGDSLMYASISKSIISSDNPLILHLGNSVYLNKPPLFFWLNAIVMKILGFNTLSANLVTLLCASGITILLFKLAKDIFNSINAGYAAVIFFCANYIVYKTSHSCRIESLLTLLILAGILLASKYAKDYSMFSLMGAGLFFGLAVLTKGYTGMIAFGACILYLFLFKSEISGFKLSLDVFASVLVFLAVFIWWVIYATNKTSFIDTFFFHETIDRLVITDSGFEKAPLYSYLLSFINYCFIMIPFLIIGFVKYKSMVVNRSSLAMMGFFSLVYLIVIHFASTKYDRYLYPLMPFLSIIAAGGFTAMLNLSLKPLIVVSMIVISLFLIIYPYRTGSKTYEELMVLEKSARQNGGQLCVSTGFLSQWEHKSAIYYFTDKFRTNNCTPSDIYINENDAFCDGYTLERNNRFSACIKNH